MQARAATPAENFLASIRHLFRYYQGLGERAMDQLEEPDLFFSPAEEANSVAVIVKHLRGNMRSRWTDFLTTDGEKPWRDRDGEFEPTLTSAREVRAAWLEGWACLFEHIDPLQPEDLGRIVYIRNEAHTVLEAINRQLAHYAYHVGQIVSLAKQIKGAGFSSLTIPRGASSTYNEKKFSGEKGRRYGP